MAIANCELKIYPGGRARGQRCEGDPSATPRIYTASRRVPAPSCSTSNIDPRHEETAVPDPVVHFEIIGNDTPALQNFYAGVFTGVSMRTTR